MEAANRNVMRFVSVPLFVAVVGFSASDKAATLEFGAPFSDHAVLQRGMRVPVWGTACPESEVSVAFAGQKKTCIAGTDGVWRVDLDPMQASSEGREVVATACSGSEKSSVVAHDVLVLQQPPGFHAADDGAQSDDDDGNLTLVAATAVAGVVILIAAVFAFVRRQ